MKSGRTLGARLVAAMVLLSAAVLALSYATTYVLVRREQYRRADQPDRRADVARCVVAGKVQNARNLLLRGGRETDVAARFGGDEFSVILPDTGRDGAVSVAERIRDRINACQFLESDGLSIHLTASIGVATLPDVAASAEELLRAADVAMYRVKDAGKNGIHIAQEASAF